MSTTTLQTVPDPVTVNRLSEVSEGRITEVVGCRNGGWKAALRARHEAPMLRPEQLEARP